MFLSERFKMLFPKSVEFKAVKLEKAIIDEKEKEKTLNYSLNG